MDIFGSIDELAAIAAWILTLDGSRDLQQLAMEFPDRAQLLHDLIDAGCVIASAHSHTDSSHRRDDDMVSADCLRQSAARVADDFSDDAVDIARRRTAAKVSVVGSMPLVKPVENLLISAGVTVSDVLTARITQTAVPTFRSRKPNHSTVLALRDVESEPQASAPKAAIIASVSRSNEPLLSLNDADPYMRAGIPHMCISVAGSRLRCGPWVIPGISPCTRCWTLVSDDGVARYASQPSSVALRAEPAHSTLALAAAVAASRSLAFIDGLTALGIPDTLEWDAIGRFVSTPVSAHPQCACTLAITDGVSTAAAR